VTDEAAGHLTPAQHDHINFYGTYHFDGNQNSVAKNAGRGVHQPLEPTQDPAERDQIRSVTKGTPAMSTGMCGPIKAHRSPRTNYCAMSGVLVIDPHRYRLEDSTQAGPHIADKMSEGDPQAASSASRRSKKPAHNRHISSAASTMRLAAASSRSRTSARPASST
jgi:hypothetical protein